MPNMSLEQIEARNRNWKILRLRGLYAFAHGSMEPENAQKVIEAVDEELKLLGAETSTEQWERIRKEVME
jgi:hypothetical protein